MQREINVPAVLAAVKQAGEFFLGGYKKAAIPQNEATLLQQLGAIDERCLAVLKPALAPAFPDTPWLVGDEFDSTGQKQPLNLPDYWLCDAMDGAIQYVQHLPGWTINLVLIRQGRPHLAVLYAPLEQELFWAQEGVGAFLNDAPMRPSTKTDPGVMLAVFDYGHQDAAHPTPDLHQRVGTLITDLLENFGIVRNYGPHGLQLAQVGAGRLDLFCQQGLDTYNWLAGILLAREAGADILTLAGQPWQWGDDSLLVAAPGVAHRFLEARSAAHSA